MKKLIKIILKNEVDCEKFYPTDYLHNNFIPLSSIPNGELVLINNKPVNFLYFLSIPATVGFSYKKYNAFCLKFISDNSRWCKLDYRGILNTYIIVTGEIHQVIYYPEYTVIPMAVMTVKKEHLLLLKPTDGDAYHKFCLVINKNFISDPEHFKLYRNFKKYCLDDLSESIDTFYTQDIIGTLYRPTIQKPVFHTVTDIAKMKEELNQRLEQIILSKQ